MGSIHWIKVFVLRASGPNSAIKLQEITVNQFGEFQLNFKDDRLLKQQKYLLKCQPEIRGKRCQVTSMGIFT